MSHTKVEEHAVKMCLTERDVANIAGVCDMFFPGDWFADPKVDCSRIGTPRVWIRPVAATNAINLSFWFGTQIDSLLYVIIQRHSDRDSHLTMGIPFGSLFAALTMCQMVLLRRLDLSSEYRQDNQIAFHQSKVWKSSTLNPLDL